MASYKGGGLNVGLMVVVVVLGLGIWAAPSMATVYTVGDVGGWGLSVDYGTWASGKPFVVGDSLVFNYQNSHNVAEVSSSDYSACSVGNAVPDSTGKTTIILKTAGTHYFICGISGHCSGGMKLAVPVSAAATGGGSTTTPAAPSGGDGTTSQSPPTATITPPAAGSGVPLPSSAGSLSPAVAVLFSLVALLFI